jgi:hypothetical protein
LRRTNRRVDGRSELNLAYQLFDQMGLAAFGERTQRALVAIGATVRKRAVETG